jgi:hypothetical protein
MSSHKAAAKRAAGKTAAKPATKSSAGAAVKAAPKVAAKKSDDTRLKSTDTANHSADHSSKMAQALARDLEAALRDGQAELLAPEALQALMAALLKTYTAQIQGQGDYFPPLASVMSVTPTDVMVTASALLKAADLQVFELGMWQSWTGR